jgi:hypothetical protein
MRRAIIVFIAAVIFVIAGPYLTGPHGKSAGAEFVYEPPDGFKPATAHELGKAALPDDAKVWVFHELTSMNPVVGGTPNPPTVVLTHSAKEMSVEEHDLAKLAEDMPSAFEGCTWVHRRHELRTRADGARVGIIEGDCDKDVDLTAFGLPPKSIKTRKLQLMFPDDLGTSIATVSYPTEQATRWEPLFEATIGKAKGVATRTPPPPNWVYGAWIAAGIVIGWLASALLARRAPADPPAPKPEEKPTT